MTWRGPTVENKDEWSMLICHSLAGASFSHQVPSYVGSDYYNDHVCGKCFLMIPLWDGQQWRLPAVLTQ